MFHVGCSSSSAFGISGARIANTSCLPSYDDDRSFTSYMRRIAHCVVRKDAGGDVAFYCARGRAIANEEFGARHECRWITHVERFEIAVVVEQQRTFDVSDREITDRRIGILSAAEQPLERRHRRRNRTERRRRRQRSQSARSTAAKPVPAPSIDLRLRLLPPRNCSTAAALEDVKRRTRAGCSLRRRRQRACWLKLCEVSSKRGVFTAPIGESRNLARRLSRPVVGTGMPSCSSTDGWPAVKETPERCCEASGAIR